MKIFVLLGKLIGILLSLLIFANQSNGQEQRITGIWSGKIDLPTVKLELFFTFSENYSGKLSATLDIPAQQAKDLECKSIRQTNDSLYFRTPELNRLFAGEFINDSTIDGSWKRQRVSIPMVLKKIDKIPELNRPQTPKPPFPYLIEEVVYTNEKSGFKLAGTLTIPENAKECPAVVLISGSGAQDRDETIYEHKMFWVIADYFALNGIATLRVDDRGVGGSEGTIRDATSEDFAWDALTGIDFLKSQKGIDPEKIGLIGHSEGGLIAPIAANLSNDVAFIMMMAGPGMVGEQILYEQNELALKAAGVDKSSIKQNRLMQEALFNILKTEKDSAKTVERLRMTYSGGMYRMLDSTRKMAVDAQVNGINSPWFRYFLTYDPQPTLSKVKCPLLALNGSKDVQVPATSNLEAIKKAVSEGGNKNVKTIEFENLNHLFQNSTTGAVNEYSVIEETIDPAVLEVMKNWILKTNSKGQSTKVR